MNITRRKFLFFLTLPAFGFYYIKTSKKNNIDIKLNDTKEEMNSLAYYKGIVAPISFLDSIT